MKKKKKWISIITSVIMLFSTYGTATFAEGEILNSTSKTIEQTEVADEISVFNNIGVSAEGLFDEKIVMEDLEEKSEQKSEEQKADKLSLFSETSSFENSLSSVGGSGSDSGVASGGSGSGGSGGGHSTPITPTGPSGGGGTGHERELTFEEQLIEDLEDIDEQNYLYLYYKVIDGKVAITGCNDDVYEIVIPETINNLPVCYITGGHGRWYDFENSRKIEIPKTVTFIYYDRIFDNSYDVTEIIVSEDNEIYSSYDGALYNKDKTKLLRCPLGKTEIRIASSTENVERQAFWRCELAKVVFEEGIKRIDDFYFSFSHPGTYDYVESEMYIPSTVTYISRLEEYLTRVIVDENNQVYKSVDGALYDKNETSLLWLSESTENLNISKTVKYLDVLLDEDSHRDYEYLESINVSEENSYFSSYDGCLFNKDKTKLLKTVNKEIISLPPEVVSMQLVPYDMFRNIDELTSIYVADGNSAYSSYDGVLYNKEQTELLYCPQKKTSIDIPDTVSVIGESAFEDSRLKEITLPQNVTLIKKYAFWMADITIFRIHNAVIKIEYGAFNDYGDDIDLYYYGTAAQWKAIDMYDSFNEEENITVHYEPTVCNEHNIIKIDRIEPTCESEGFCEHWHCINCGENYFDPEGLEPIAYISYIAIPCVPCKYDNDICIWCGEERIRSIKMTVGDDKIYKNGKEITLDAPPILHNNRIFVPIRAVAESMNLNVTWDSDDDRVTVIDKYNKKFSTFLESVVLILQDDRTYIDMQTIFDYFLNDEETYDVSFDGTTFFAKLIIDGEQLYNLKMVIGDKEIIKDGQKISLAVPPILKSRRTEDGREDTIYAIDYVARFLVSDSTQLENMLREVGTLVAVDEDGDDIRYFDVLTFFEKFMDGYDFSFDGTTFIAQRITREITVSSANGKPGKSVDVVISVKNNPGIAVLGFDIEYDDNAMKLVNVAANDIFAPGDITPPDDLSKNPYIFSAMNAEHNCTSNGKLVTLTFRIDNNCPDGDYKIIVKNLEAYNVLEEPKSFDIVNGFISVKDFLAGDVTNDGLVNRMDLLRLGKYFAGWDVEINEAAADVTGDGAVNRMDLLRLGKYFAGWDVTLGK